MDLTAYRLSPTAPRLSPASAHRDWMDRTQDRHAYRCLPLSIANAHGWVVHAPVAFSATWNGGPQLADLVVDEAARGFVESNFGRGVLTMHTHYLFRTPPGWNLMVSGLHNEPKDGAVALVGVIEADWLSYPFTMNWHFTRPGTVTFKRDEPFCMVFPVAKRLDQWTCRIRELSEEPELKARYADMLASRAANPTQWQRHYFLGREADGTMVEGHQHKLRLKCPV